MENRFAAAIIALAVATIAPALESKPDRAMLVTREHDAGDGALAKGR